MKHNKKIKQLLELAKPAKAFKIILIHDNQVSSIRSENKKLWKIICGSEKLPFSKDAVLNLTDEQTKLLEAILALRKANKKISSYEKLMQSQNK